MKKNLIQQILERDSITRIELASRIGVTEGAIRKWEKNGFDTVKMENIRNLAKYANLNINEIMGLASPTDNEVFELAREIRELSEDKRQVIQSVVNSYKNNKE